MKIALPAAAAPAPGWFPTQPGAPVFHRDNVITEPH